MKDIEEIGIVSLAHKACASITMQCLDDAGITDRQTAFDRQISNAKKMGLMPDDQKVIRETLKEFGFFMQSTALENNNLKQVLKLLGNLKEPAVVFAQISDYKHLGGNMFALRFDGSKYSAIGETVKVDNLLYHFVTHVWIRWDDGVDRSPYPRKTVKRNVCRSSRIVHYEDTSCYKHFQPNPLGNYIGDCVVRAVSGALDIPWEEAIDLLSSAQETTVNATEVFPLILKKNGFFHRKALTRNGRRLDGKSFCEEMNRKCRNGERIFAYVGRLHVAAIVPVINNDGKAVYKIIDSWNSTNRLIGEYWIMRPAKESDSAHTNNRPTPKAFCIGEHIIHPSFGDGTVTEIVTGVLTVDFGVNGLRRLGAAWVQKNCSYRLKAV